jgi:hypothetical protein
MQSYCEIQHHNIAIFKLFTSTKFLMRIFIDIVIDEWKACWSSDAVIVTDEQI